MPIGEEIIGYLVIYAAELFVLLHYCQNLFPLRYTLKRTIPIAFLLYSIPFALVFLHSLAVNAIAFTTAAYLVIFLLFRSNWLVALYNALLHLLIMGSTELIVGSLASSWMLHFMDQTVSSEIFIPFGVITKLLYLIVSEIASLLIRRLRHSPAARISPESSILIIHTFLNGILLFFLHAVGQAMVFSLWMRALLSALSVLFLSVNIASYWLFDRIQQQKEELNQLRSLQLRNYLQAKYYSELQEETENRSLLIHDIRNHLYTLASLMKDSSPSEASEYLEKLIQLPALSESIRICSNNLLNSILNRYRIKCLEHRWDFDADIRFHTFRVDDTELTALFCNLLDNAVESLSKEQEGYLRISTVYDGEAVIITTDNTCTVNPFHGNELISHKEKPHHGFGLKSINSIAKKHGGHCTYSYDSSLQRFRVIVSLPTADSKE